MLKDLVKMASKLDALGLSKEADTIDTLIRKIAGSDEDDSPPEGMSQEKWDAMRAEQERYKNRKVRPTMDMIDSYRESYHPRDDDFRSLKAPPRNKAAPDLDTLLNDLDMHGWPPGWESSSDDPTVDEDGNDVDWDWMNNDQ